MRYSELMQGFAAKVGVAERDMHDAATAFEMDDMNVGFIHDDDADAAMAVAA